MTTNTLRFGLIGAGRIGGVHAKNIDAHPATELVYVADTRISMAEEVVARHGGNATTSPEAVLADSGLDAVVVAAPTPQHLTLIEACVDAGLPVLCEKPIDLDRARVDLIRDKVAATEVPVAIGFNQRFDPAFNEVRRRLDAHEIGTIEQVTIVSRDPAPPPADYIAVSGGIFLDMSIHDFDMARFLLGDIAEVYATGSTMFDEGAMLHGDYDTVVVTLKAVSGALVTITNSRHSSFGYDQRLEAFGAEGLLRVENAATSLVGLNNSSGVETKSPHLESFLDRYAESYRLELAEFVKLVQGGESSSPRFEDGRAAQLIAEAAMESSKKGRVVKLM